MKSSFDLHAYAKEAIHGAIRDLANVDGLSWDLLSEWAGFKGASSWRSYCQAG